MKAFWTYTLARFGVFAVTFGVLWLIGSIWIEWSALTTSLVLLVALVVSAILSIFLLEGLRNNLARHIQARATRMTERIEESRRAEDVD